MKEEYLKFEAAYLSPYAVRSDATKGRATWENPCPLRTEFQRDRDRIVHSKSFRRLKHKTQVFLAPSGDHFRTRMTHTIEVMQIARTISRCLRLNEDLTEAIAFGHDLGHTPFGHIGERILAMESGHFEHNEQSLRVVTLLENDGKGLNLTEEVCDGILNHTKRGNPATLEGKVVSLSDRIAYLNHDIDDAIRAGMLSEDELPSSVEKLLGVGKRAKINSMVSDIVNVSLGRDKVEQSDDFASAMEDLRAFMFRKVYFADHASKEEDRAREWLIKLYDFYRDNPDEVPSFYRSLSDKPTAYITDFMASMTDTYVIKQLEKYFGYKWDSIL